MKMIAMVWQCLYEEWLVVAHGLMSLRFGVFVGFGMEWLWHNVCSGKLMMGGWMGLVR